MTLKITSAIFVACAAGKDGMPPPGKPIIALVGRSNVGKSSLINLITGRRELAKTSATPGKTLTINYYLINDAFYIVDLPGYGFAKVSKITKEKVQKMVDDFFATASPLLGIIQILDVRHPPSTMDLQIFNWIQDSGFRYVPVITKIDKLGQSELNKQIKVISKKLGLQYSIQFSAKTGSGKEELLDVLHAIQTNTPENAQSGPPKSFKMKGPEKSKGSEKVSDKRNQNKGKNPNKNQNQGQGQNQNPLKHRPNDQKRRRGNAGSNPRVVHNSTITPNPAVNASVNLNSTNVTNENNTSNVNPNDNPNSNLSSNPNSGSNASTSKNAVIGPITGPNVTSPFGSVSSAGNSDKSGNSKILSNRNNQRSDRQNRPKGQNKPVYNKKKSSENFQNKVKTENSPKTT
ncbi:MAG: YihA family ribosome biogenesis GTP-binding protein [Candidatus Riflebacteria bacterium]|nr:YihA family ribosome biogenesis GTP-binding protein [Candidatus Riflebacteria bacterium]